jgi:hypothetical protein
MDDLALDGPSVVGRFEEPLVGGEPAIPGISELAADVLNVVGMTGVGQRLLAHMQPVLGLTVTDTRRQLRPVPLIPAGRTRMPLGQPTEALLQVLAGPTGRAVN